MKALLVLALLALVGLPGCKPNPPASEAYPNLISIVSEEHFQQAVLESPHPAVVDFYADWCAPCRKLKPILDELAADWQGNVTFYTVNVDHHAELASRYRVRSIPDVRFFNQGREVGGAAGYRAADFWRREVQALASPTSDAQP